MSPLKAPTPTQADLVERQSLLRRLWRARACYRYWYQDAIESTMDEDYSRSFARIKTWDMIWDRGSRG